jgi:hypothetical protein
VGIIFLTITYVCYIYVLNRLLNKVPLSQGFRLIYRTGLTVLAPLQEDRKKKVSAKYKINRKSAALFNAAGKAECRDVMTQKNEARNKSLCMNIMICSASEFSFIPSYDATAQTGRWCPLYRGFLNTHN